jgi:hypothetical protein
MENLDVKQSIKTIEQAVQEARRVPHGAYYYFILWGIILFLYYILNYFALTNPDPTLSGLQGWFWVVFPIGGFLSSRRSKQDDLKETAKSIADKVYLFAFSGFAFAYITIYLAAEFGSFNYIVIPIFCSLLGLTVFVTGGIVNERFSIIMGIVGMLIGAYCLKLEVSQQCLLASVACLFTCIVPGVNMKIQRV